MAAPELIRCPRCGAQNRIPPDKLRQGLRPICGRCKTSLPIAGRPITVTDASFSADVERSPIPVLLDCWAPWCAPCRMVAPAVEDLAKDMSGRIRVAKLNVDENPAVASRFRVQSIPTLLVLKAGRELDRIVGAQPKSEIAKRLRQALD